MFKQLLTGIDPSAEERSPLYNQHINFLILGVLFISSYFLILVIIKFSYDYNPLMLKLLIASIIGFLAFVSMSHLYIYKNILNSRNIHNAILRDIVSLNTAFTLIIQNNGATIYADKNFYKIFEEEMRNYTNELDALVNSSIIPSTIAKNLASTENLEYFKERQWYVGEEFINRVRNSIDYNLEEFKGYPLGIKLALTKQHHETDYLIVRVYYDNNSLLVENSFDNFDQLNIASILTQDNNILDCNYKACELLGGSKQNFLTTANRYFNYDNRQLVLPQDNKKFAYDLYPVRVGFANNYSLYAMYKTSSQSATELWPFLEKANMPNVMVDEKYNIVLYNEAFTELLGIEKPGEYNFLQLLDDKSLINTFNEKINVLDEGQVPSGFEASLVYEDKVNINLYINSLIYNDRPHYIFTLFDTTKYKKLEASFVHSQKMQAVGQLAGAVAHDFNNLLTAMMGFADLLLAKHPPGDSSFSNIMQIKQNANRAANLVRQLLAFSRKQVLDPEIVDLNFCIAELSNLINRLIGENIELNIEHEPETAKVKVDQGQLEQVIINLAVNARDAMPDGGKLDISTHNCTINSNKDLPSDLISPVGDEDLPPGDYVLVKISDTGTGIPEDIVEKIFDPFFSTKELGAGTGLGLATVYGIIKQFGGYIKLRTKYRRGTSFYIYLQAAGEEEIQKAKEEAEEEENESLSNNDLTGYGKILIVEDEIPVRTIGSNALQNKGYEVLEAEDAENALEVMEKEGSNIQIIITDVIMPGMNGPDFVRKVQETYPNIKVIFISGYAEDAFSDNLDIKGKFNFLQKPFNLKQLTTKVKKVLIDES
jgi:signal transduction histidine kinase/CheY-like chemotaxis protein